MFIRGVWLVRECMDRIYGHIPLHCHLIMKCPISSHGLISSRIAIRFRLIACSALRRGAGHSYTWSGSGDIRQSNHRIFDSKKDDVTRRKIYHHDYHDQGHNHHIDQSHSKMCIHYTQNSAFSMENKMLYISIKISIEKIRWFFFVYTEGGDSPPSTLIIMVYTQDLK